MNIAIYFVVLPLLHCGATHLKCDLPPSVWCNTPETARRCGVVKQCEQNVWLNNASDAKLVDFTLYLESLCPDCQNFITTQLWPTWLKVGHIMNLQLVPYGNAEEEKTSSGWKFTCQHGPDECFGNVIETCAIYLIKNVTIYFPFINCIEKSEKLPEESYIQCAKQFEIDLKPLKKCAEGAMGNELEHKMAEKTNKLNPPNEYVPWVTLNGVHTDDIQKQAQENLLKLICDTYKGPTPSACKRQMLRHSKYSKKIFQ